MGEITADGYIDWFCDDENKPNPQNEPIEVKEQRIEVKEKPIEVKEQPKTLVNPKAEKLANIEFKIREIVDIDSRVYHKVMNVVAPASLIAWLVTFGYNTQNINNALGDVWYNVVYAGTLLVTIAEALFTASGFTDRSVNRMINGKSKEFYAAPITQICFIFVVVGLECAENAVEYALKLPVKLSAKAIVKHQKNKERKIKNLPNGKELLANFVDAKENKKLAKANKKIAKYENKKTLKEQKQSQKIINQTDKINQHTQEIEQNR